MNYVPICFMFDHRVAMQAGVCFSSLLDKAHKETYYEIFVLHGGDIMGEYEETLLRVNRSYKNCTIHFIELGDVFTHAYKLRGIPNNTYYRLLIPELLPQYNRIIVSDIDIIFNIDLWDLYTIDFNQNYIAAVKNSIVNKRYVRSLGCDPLQYVNCGFFMYNSQEIRKDNIVGKFKKLVGGKYFYMDQDIINIVCRNKIKYISPMYNSNQSFYEKYFRDPNYLNKLFSAEEIEEGFKAAVTINHNRQEETGLIHYNGLNPWDDLCWRFDIWWEYYRNSMYFNNDYYYNHYSKVLNPPIKDTTIKLLKTTIKKPFGKFIRKIAGY